MWNLTITKDIIRIVKISGQPDLSSGQIYIKERNKKLALALWLDLSHPSVRQHGQECNLLKKQTLSICRSCFPNSLCSFNSWVYYFFYFMYFFVLTKWNDIRPYHSLNETFCNFNKFTSRYSLIKNNGKKLKAVKRGSVIYWVWFQFRKEKTTVVNKLATSQFLTLRIFLFSLATNGFYCVNSSNETTIWNRYSR